MEVGIIYLESGLMCIISFGVLMLYSLVFTIFYLTFKNYPGLSYWKPKLVFYVISNGHAFLHVKIVKTFQSVFWEKHLLVCPTSA